MGIETALIVGGIVLAAGMAIFMPRQDPAANDQMNPATIDSFKVNQTAEGAVVPLIAGRVRITTNIMWYGNLLSEEVMGETSGGGKGGGGGSSSSYCEYALKSN